MADLEALSAPNRSIWQPISYMNPIDTYVGNKGKLAALKATDLEFQKADSTIQTTKDATELVRNLQGDNPYVKELADKNEAELSRISELKDPYEMQKQTKVLANSFAKQINDTNSQLGATVQAYIKSEENLKNAKNDTDKTVALELQAQHNNSDNKGQSGVSKYYNPVTESYQGALDNLQMNHYDKYDNIEDDAHATFTNYAKDQTALAGFGLQSRKGADGKFEITSKSTNSGISREEADRAANNMFEANAKIQDQFKNKALAAASEKIFNATGKRGLVQTTKEGQDLYNEEYNKLKDSYVGYIKDKLAHNQHDKTIQGRANAYELENTRKKNAASLLEPPVQEKQTFFGGNYKNKYTKYSSENNEKQGNFISYNNQKLIPADAAKEAVKNGLIKDSEYETAKTILNYNANPSLFNTTLAEIFNDSESPVKANERALLTVKLEKAGLLNVIKNENADLSSNQSNWIKGVLMNGLDTPNTIANELLKRTKSGNTREEKIASDEFNNYLDNYISKKDVKEKYLNKYNDYHKNLESIVSNGSEDDVYYQKQTETKDTPSVFESGDVTFDEGLGGKKRKDFSSVASWFENSDIPENADITYKRIATNRNINTGGSEWQVIVKDKPNGTILKSGFAQVAPSPEVKEIMQPITKLWEQVYSGDSQPTYYKFVKDNNNNSKILPISEKEFKNTPDNLKPAVFRLSTTDIDGNPIKGGILKSGNGNISTLDNFANKYASHNVNKFSELGISRFWNPDREKQKVNSATQYYNNKQQEEEQEVNPEDIQR